MSLDHRHEPEHARTDIEHEQSPAPAEPPARSTRVDETTGPLEVTRAVCGPIWGDRRLGVAVAVAFGAAWGLGAGWWMARGPLTTAEALWSIAISLTIGALAGFAARTRWAMLVTPLAFVAFFELARVGSDGPTVDGIETSTYGLLALAVGRGFHGLVSVYPMLLGTAAGAGTARLVEPVTGSSTSRTGRYVRRSVAVLGAVMLLVLAAGLVRPARTAPIVDADGTPIAGSVAELTTIEINGHDLAVMIRGHDVGNPVLLFLAGGPGGSEMGAMRNHLPELEKHFTVVTWDQRGTGKSYPELDPTDTITLEGFVDDTIAVTDHLRERFDQDRIYLLGQSWGSTLGVLAVQEHPERYRAFIGTGQMVSQRATDVIFYDDTLEWAESTGNTGLVSELTSIGPPPYERMLDYESALSYEHDVYPYEHEPNAEGEGGFSENFLVEEYALIDQVHLLAAFVDTFSVLYPQLQDIDFRDTATDFEVPVFFVQGAHEADGRAEPFDDWYPTIDAPTKDLIVLDTSGHRPLFEQPDEFVDYMVNTVLEETADATPASADSGPNRTSDTARQVLDVARERYGALGALAVVSVDGRRTSLASGVADREGTPASVDMRFRIGSITKTIIAALALDQVAQGRLALDDVVFDLVGPPLRSEPTVSVRQLLAHTSGVFDIGNEGDPVSDVALLADPALLAEVDALVARASTGASVTASDRLVVALAELHDREFEPGDDYRYSNTNYQLLGMVVEAVAGGSLASVLTDRIVDPLDLQSTSLAPDDLSSPAFRGFAVDLDTGAEVDATDDLLAFGNGASGGVVSTADELLEVMTAIVHGSLLPSSLRAEMLTASTESDGTYGLGIGSYELTCGSFYGHQGRVNGTVSIALVSQETPGTGVVVAMNRTAGNPELLSVADDLVCAS